MNTSHHACPSHPAARRGARALRTRQRLSEAQFQQAIEGLDVGQRTLDIAHGVLVQGRPQAAYAAALGLTRGAVSQAVSRVRRAHQARSLPQGYEQVTAVLPEHQAYIVRRWAADAVRRLAPAA